MAVREASDDAVKLAAQLIRSGGLVAFPTETVYGLGANGLDAAACARIFKAKGRPQDNPLILHISGLEQLADIAVIDERTNLLAERFWPGPLTLVLSRTSLVPDIVTAGRNTVAVRFPGHQVACRLIQEAGVPIAAPSANISGRPSATTAEHVHQDLGGRVDMIIDGGAAECGIESTILDVSGKIPCLLRPGFVTPREITSIIGSIEIDPSVLAVMPSTSPPKAPGMSYAHYQPLAELYLVAGGAEKARRAIAKMVADETQKHKLGVITTNEGVSSYIGVNALVFSLGSEAHPEVLAANLFSVLRRLDDESITKAYAESFNAEGLEASIMNRLRKAASYRTI